MLEFLGFLCVTFLLIGVAYIGAVISALSAFDGCKKMLYGGFFISFAGILGLLIFWYNMVTISIN